MQCGSRLTLGDELREALGGPARRAARRAAGRAGTWRRPGRRRSSSRRRRSPCPARVKRTPSAVARGLRAHHVGHGEHPRAALAREAHRGERVGGLAGLGDADHEVARADHGVAVAVLGGDVHLDRQPRPLFDRVAADQPGVVGGAAGDDHDPPHALEQRLVEGALLLQVDAVAARGAVGDRVGDRVRLFVDLLEHEGLVARLLGGRLVPVDVLLAALDGRAGGVHDPHAVGPQHGDLAVLEVLHAARLGEEARDGRGDELLALAAAEDQRALLARPDQRLGLVEAHRDERVVPLELGRRRRGRPRRGRRRRARRSGARSPRRRSRS